MLDTWREEGEKGRRAKKGGGGEEEEMYTCVSSTIITTNEMVIRENPAITAAVPTYNLKKN